MNNSPDPLLRWLVGIATVVAMGLSTWAGATIIEHGQKIAAATATVELVNARLARIEDLLIQIIRDKR